jgi:cobalt-zinc-cadmium resistance protein CzcA
VAPRPPRRLLLGGLAAAHPVDRRRVHAALDEGALWIRATMPYTISFEESRRSRPAGPPDPALVPRGHGRRLEHGRPDDGTDPTGFFNDEFFVGLKPYREWNGAYRTSRP